MAATVELYSAAGPHYAITLEARWSAGAVDAIILTAQSVGGAIIGQGEFKVRLDLPNALIDGGKLKTWTAIQGEIKQKRKATEFKVAAELEQLRDRLRETLASLSLDVSAAAGGFLGIDGVGFAAAAASARLSIDLLLLDPTLEPSPAADAAVLTARLSAGGTVQLGGATCKAAMLITVVVTRGGLIEALPSLSIEAPEAARIPAFDLRWPRIDWPQLSWPALDVQHLATLLRFDLPIPRMGNFDQPLHVAWSVPPKIALALDAQKRLTVATTQAGTGELVCDTKDPNGNPTMEKVADISGFEIALASGGALLLAGTIQPATVSITLPRTRIERPEALPFTVESDPGTLTVAISAAITLPGAAGANVIATFDLPRVLIRAKSDPALLLALAATYEQTYDSATGSSTGKLTRVEIVEPYPVAVVALAARAAEDAADGLIRLIGAIRLPKSGLPDTGLAAVLDRIGAMIGAAAMWLARQEGVAVDALLGIAEAIGRALQEVERWLREALKGDPSIADPHLAVELRLDARSFALRQAVISPAWTAPPSAAFTGRSSLLDIEVPLAWRPSLVIDLDGPPSIALIALQADKGALTLGTDLWLARNAGIESVADTAPDGKRPGKRLLQVSATLKTAQPIVIFRIRSGKPSFLETMKATVVPLVETGVSIAGVSGPVVYEPAGWGNLDIGVQVEPGTAERLLPFLQSSAGNTGSDFLSSLDQYISVKPGSVQTADDAGKVTLPIDATLKLRGPEIKFQLKLLLDLRTFVLRFESSETIEINGKKEDNHFDVFGLSGKLLPKTYKQGDQLPSTGYPFFTLDFSNGDARLSLADTARLDLSYGKVASDGRGIVFRVDGLSLSRGGLDLDARVDPDSPVQLAGVDMPFRFDKGGLSIKRSVIQAFSITGAGQLPPELVGEANVTVSISLGRGRDGSLIVQSAQATLDKSNDPIFCHGTRFKLTLSAIGLEFQDFSTEAAGYHFYFTLTGSAEFRPRAGEFADGLLKNFGSLTITLDKAPLARDPSMLLRAIEFQVAVEPKKRINFFNLFTFELRGIGFHPASPAFGGKPAMSISGQVNFVEAGDLVSPRFDFHKLWIAPPKDGETLPQVRFDGLTVGVRFGGAASIEGTAIAVDDQLPSLYKPGALPANVTARGFLASGKLTIKGWGQMAASMGFLELQKQPGGEIRQAFFLYGQEGELSIEIPTPLGPIYLREVGFGFGFRFTLAAFNRADQVRDVKGLIAVLDDISKYQGDLASVRAWEPEAAGNRLTLALRGLISISSASDTTEYNAEGEKDLPNPVLFDIVAALRSDLTFFMNARVWVARNYADWHDSSATADAWRTNPTLRGYVYLSVPRKEFLARMIADGTGDVEGKHPELPAPLVQAMKAVRWSATTYIRPGLFHQEFGWPYELSFTFERGSLFRIDCQGGLVNRIEDLSILYGIAFRARGFAQIGGSVGGRSFGASVIARADFSVDAKFIAYLALNRFSETLFYGSLALDVSISLQVRVWLEFSIGIKDIHLEIGFSLALTISVAIEVAVSPREIGGRASASVGIGAFGRSIRLGIGFGFNEGALATARSRVERFLALGLTVATPDAEQGIAPPAAEQPRGPASHDADQAVDGALEKHDDMAVGPSQEPKGRALQPTGYWAMLFPVAGELDRGDDERFVMIFVPRDHSETGLEAETLPRVGPSGGRLGTFYPPPPAFDRSGGPVAHSLTIRNRGAPRTTVKRLASDGAIGAVAVFGDDAVQIDVTYDVSRPAFRSGDDELPLGRCLAQCFVRRGAAIADLFEPEAKQIQSDPERLPNAREAAAQVLAAAGRDQIGLKAEERAANQIEERRSAVIASLCESAGKLAMGGESAWTVEAANPGLDIRSLGLAFVVNRTEIDALFDPPPGEDLPRRARFELGATDPNIGAIDKSVHLYNPPERMFRERGPKLAEPVVEATPTGIRLDWDLEPAFGQSIGAWHDPEFNLKHYRVERVLTDGNGALIAEVPPRRATVKAAAPMRLVRDLETGEFAWRFLRPNAQYVDDLSDLPEKYRAAILPGGEKLSVSVRSVRYVVVPVDTAGTEGAPTPLQLDVVTPRRACEGLRRAVLHIEYRGASGRIQDLEAPAARPDLTLGLDDGIDLPLAKGQAAADRPKLDGDRRYVLRVRRERGVPTGLYGADAVTDALARPAAGDFARKHVMDEDFPLTLKKETSAHAKRERPWFDDPLPVQKGDGYKFDSPGDLDRFMKAIGVDTAGADRKRDGARGVRFAIRPWHDPDTQSAAPWCPADITLLIDPRPLNAPTTKPPPVAVPIEIFEHPVAIDPAPLPFDDLGGESGRVLVWHPSTTGLLAGLLEDDPGEALVRLRDGERRVATRVRWNARPAAEDADAGPNSAKDLARLFGGFDLFEVDSAREVEGATNAAAGFGLTYTFGTSVDDGDPGNGFIRLNRKPHAQATVLYADLRDRSGVDQGAALDRLVDSPDRVKGQVRLIKAADPSRWLTFDLTGATTAVSYRKLLLACTDASHWTELDLFGSNDVVQLLFTRLPARHVARVQALPASSARLDPPEIADFAKVEAHYPSETRRLQNSGKSRRVAWYSPAESFVVWPKPVLRRPLSINVDETILTELLSSGRPNYFTAKLKVGQKDYKVQRGAEKPPADGHFTDERWTSGRLRRLMQDLTWDPAAAAKHHEDRPAEFRTGRVTLTAWGNGAPDVALASAEWPVDLDPPLHPVLADTIDWARYADMPAAAYPALVVKTETFDAQLSPQVLDQSVAVEFRLQGWPTALPPRLLGFRSGAETLFPEVPRFTFPPATPNRQADLRAAIARLVTTLSARERGELAKEIAKSPGTYANLTLMLRCVPALSGPPVAEASFPVVAASIGEDHGGSTYRRYEPVLEPSPKVGATDVAGWIDETPEERDPYGWGILRTLGLAAGLRLYDTETRQYLEPRDALARLNEAMTKALAWYDADTLGAPFIDVVTRAGGTMQLASFDGGTPAATAADVNRLIDHDALALTQISLRPLVDRWRRYAGDAGVIHKPVAYLAVRFVDPSDGTTRPRNLEIDMTKLGAGKVAVADVLDLTTTLAKPLAMTLCNQPSVADAELKKLNAELTGGAGEQVTHRIDLSNARPGDVVALVRATVVAGDAAAAFGEAWIDGGFWRRIEQIADPMLGDGVEPFGRFGDMAADRYRRLADLHQDVKDATGTLARYATRRWPDGWPSSDEARDALIARLPDWTRRFVQHAPALRPPRHAHFSLAEVTRPDPWRVGLRDDGTMEVLLTHDDRKRRLKRYAVRPFGRYESFVEALRGLDDAAPPRGPQLLGAWSDRLAAPGGAPGRFEESWSRRLLDVVIPRTEPLTPPVLVDAKRIEIQPPGATRTRRVLEFIYRRHAEEILSESNVTVEGSLSFETMAVGFWREFPMQRWAQDLVPHIDTAAGFAEELKPGPEPAGLIASADRFGGLAEPGGRYPDGWRGMLALRTEALPFFFRIHAVAYASAGVVVSSPVVATIEEGHYDLHLPWQQGLLGQTTPAPRWSVQRRDGASPGIYLVFHVPLVRLVDGMPPETRPIWLTQNAVPQVFTLPDPAARYEIRAVTIDGAGLTSVTAELDVIGEQRVEWVDRTKPEPCPSRHRVNVVGPLFEAGSAAPAAIRQCTGHGEWWQAEIAAKLGQREEPAQEVFAPRIDPVDLDGEAQHPLTLIELAPQALAPGAAWAELAPQTTATVTVTPVSNTNGPAFAQFKADVMVWRDAYAPYATHPAGKAILDFLQAWVDTDGNTPPPATLTAQAFTWGLPRLADDRPPAVAISHAAIGEWRAPTQAGIEARGALRKLQASLIAPGYGQAGFERDVLGPLRTELRRLSAFRKGVEPGNRFGDFPPFVAPVPDGLSAAALAVGLAKGHGGAGLLPDCTDVIAAVPVEADPANQAAAIVALIEAVEVAPFTALAIADLGPLEDGRTRALVHLPGKALLDPAVVQALTDLGAGDTSAWRAVSLLLRMPPTDDERDAIRSAIAAAVTNAAERQALADLAERSVTGQVLGVGRKPGLKVFRGSADPAEDMIVRSDGGAQQCQ